MTNGAETMQVLLTAVVYSDSCFPRVLVIYTTEKHMILANFGEGSIQLMMGFIRERTAFH